MARKPATTVVSLEIATPERILLMKMLYGNAFILKQASGPDLLLDSTQLVIERIDPPDMEVRGRSPISELRDRRGT